jgi:hypothetical protein
MTQINIFDKVGAWLEVCSIRAALIGPNPRREWEKPAAGRMPWQCFNQEACLRASAIRVHP